MARKISIKIKKTGITKEYTSISAASKELGISRITLQRMLKNQAKTKRIEQHIEIIDSGKPNKNPLEIIKKMENLENIESEEHLKQNPDLGESFTYERTKGVKQCTQLIQIQRQQITQSN